MLSGVQRDFDDAERAQDHRRIDVAHMGDPERLAGQVANSGAQEERIEVGWEKLWNIEPILFDDRLIGFADEAVHDVAGASQRLPSGPLHDAAEVSRRGADRDGVRAEPARPLAHQAGGHEARTPRALGAALDRLATRTLAWLRQDVTPARGSVDSAPSDSMQLTGLGHRQRVCAALSSYRATPDVTTVGPRLKRRIESRRPSSRKRQKSREGNSGALIPLVIVVGRRKLASGDGRPRGPAVTRRLINAPTTSWDARIANHGVTAGLFFAALLVYGVVIPVELISKVT